MWRLAKRGRLALATAPSMCLYSSCVQRHATPPPVQAVERAVRSSMAAGSTDAVLPGMILNTAKVGCTRAWHEGRAAQAGGVVGKGCLCQLAASAALPALASHIAARSPRSRTQTVTFADPLAGGAQRSVPAGRLECTMQVCVLGVTQRAVAVWCALARWGL